MVVRILKYHSLYKNMRDIELFIECCKLRYQYDEVINATSQQWRELAQQFQVAKGAHYSYMAEYCERKAGIA